MEFLGIFQRNATLLSPIVATRQKNRVWRHNRRTRTHTYLRDLCASLWAIVAIEALGLLLAFRADRRSDIAAHLRYRLAVPRCERIEALTLHRFARDGAARSDFPA